MRRVIDAAPKGVLHLKSQGNPFPLATRASTSASDHSSHGPYVLRFFLRVLSWLLLKLLMQIDLFNINNVYLNVIRVTQNAETEDGRAGASAGFRPSLRTSFKALPVLGRTRSDEGKESRKPAPALAPLARSNSFNNIQSVLQVRTCFMCKSGGMCVWGGSVYELLSRRA
jgi:hypothetical protein